MAMSVMQPNNRLELTAALRETMRPRSFARTPGGQQRIDMTNASTNRSNEYRRMLKGHPGQALQGHRCRAEENMKAIMVSTLVILALFTGVAKAQDDIEKKKIDFLISSVENLKGAKFIRNGSEYDGKKAADHLRMKLKSAGDKVQTADDFILLCASKSYLSGKPYTIRSSGGKTENSGQYFREKLKEYK